MTDNKFSKIITYVDDIAFAVIGIILTWKSTYGRRR